MRYENNFFPRQNMLLTLRHSNRLLSILRSGSINEVFCTNPEGPEGNNVLIEISDSLSFTLFIFRAILAGKSLFSIVFTNCSIFWLY